MKRRDFLKQCTAGVALAAMPQFLVHAGEISFPETVLTKADGTPLTSKDIQPRTEYLFHYPYKSTPCFLIDLGTPVKGGEAIDIGEEGQYKWLGGVGPNQSVVAFLAICPHQLQYPNKQVSMINFNPLKSDVAGQPGRIVCCAHNSVYDPAKGGIVEKGPAPHPLTAVKLVWDEKQDQYKATALYGHDLIHDFFKAYKRKLKKEYGRTGYKEMTADTAPVVPGKEYSAMQVTC